jgi:hypothetical protein
MSDNQERMLSGMNLDKVAEILDIDQQTLNNAFTQARSNDSE